MSKLSPRKEAWQKRQRRVRRKVVGSGERPRLNIYRSSRHIYAQIIDDEANKTLGLYFDPEPRFQGRPQGGRGPKRQKRRKRPRKRKKPLPQQPKKRARARRKRKKPKRPNLRPRPRSGRPIMWAFSSPGLLRKRVTRRSSSTAMDSFFTAGSRPWPTELAKGGLSFEKTRADAP